MSNVLPIAGAIALFAWSLWGIPRFWSGVREYRLEQNPFAPRWLQRALRRQLHITLALGIALCVWIGTSPTSGDGSYPLVPGVSALLFFALLAVVVCVALFNRPAILVPRRFRAEPGILRELIVYLMSRRRDRT